MFGITTVTADNWFSCLQKLYHSSWTKSTCHVAWQWSRLNQMRPLVLSVPGWKNLGEQKLDLSLWEPGQGAAVYLCECTRVNQEEMKMHVRKYFHYSRNRKITVLKWPAGCSCQLTAPLSGFWQRKVNLQVLLLNVTKVEEDTFGACSTATCFYFQDKEHCLISGHIQQ